MGFIDQYALILIISLQLLSSDGYPADGVKIGGICEYKQYAGTAEIISIVKKADLNTGNEKYQVKFIFIPKEEIKEKFAQPQGKTFELLLRNSSYLGPKFLEKYNIKIGKSFICIMRVIVKGTCTPVLFEFPAINIDDYFE